MAKEKKKTTLTKKGLPRKNKPGAGRPEIPIDWKDVEYSMMCCENQEEVAALHGMSVDTLQIRFKEHYGENYSAYSARLYSKGDGVIRRSQIESAEKGNTTMQLWLGKVRLGQKEPDGVNNTSPNDSLHALQHQIMQISNKLDMVTDENKQLKQRLGILPEETISTNDGDQPQTEQEFLGGDTPL